MKTILRLLAAAILALVPAAALAAPIAYAPVPLDTIQLDTIQSTIAGVHTNVNTMTPNQYITSGCSGTTAVTCQGLRLQLSYTGLTIAAGATSAAQTVTDASVTANLQIFCATVNYAGTGSPIPTGITPSAGSFTWTVLNAAGSGALNATVVINCMVYN